MSQISEESFDWQGFAEYLRAVRRLQDSSIGQFMSNLRKFANDFYELPLSTYDYRAVRSALAKAERQYASSTMNLRRIGLRHWYCFLHDVDEIQDSKLKSLLRCSPVVPRRVLRREDLLSTQDVEKMCARAQSRTWPAMFAIMWDMAMRPSELCRLDYEDLNRDANGWYLEFARAKTRKRERHYLLTWVAFKYFMPYYRSHPGKGIMFPRRNGRRMTSSHVKDNIKHYSKLLGRRVYPYLFRKSASTWWYRVGLLDIQSIKKRMGHQPKSTVFEQHYLMLFEDDYSDAVLKAQGADVPEIEPYIQQKCISCHTVNPPESGECMYCSAVLDKESDRRGAVVEAYELQEQIEKLEREKHLLEEEMKRIASVEKRLDVIERMVGTEEDVEKAIRKMKEA